MPCETFMNYIQGIVSYCKSDIYRRIFAYSFLSHVHLNKFMNKGSARPPLFPHLFFRGHVKGNNYNFMSKNNFGFGNSVY